MPRALTAQDRLALAFTSYGSVRAMARDMGITHQKLGRWLREGETREDDDTGKVIRVGVKAIPASAADMIDKIYSNHARYSKAQAKADGLPFNPEAVAFFERRFLDKTTDNGEPIKGDRVFVEATQFIKPDLRRRVIEGAAKSKQFMHVSIRSVIDLSMYNKAANAVAKKRRIQRDEWQQAARDQFVFKAQTSATGTVATPYASIGNGRDYNDPADVADAIEKRLREKHEPATGFTGTVLAASYLFQLIPERERPANATPRKPRSKAPTRRNAVKGRGPK